MTDLNRRDPIDEPDLAAIEVEFAPLLANIGRIITSAADIDEVYDRFAEAVTAVIPADRLSIVVVDAQAWRHKARYYAGIDVPLATLDVWHSLDGQVLETVVRSKRPQIVDESNVAAVLAQSPRLQDGIAAGLRTWMDVPVILEQTVVAVMRFMSSTPNAYDARDQAVAVLIAAQIAGAVANAQSIESLLAAQAELARSNAELEQFAYVASHDLQEPLRVVGSYVQLLSRRYAGRLDARADRYISRSMAGVERMRTLINDLLTYSRVGTRGLELAPVRTEAVVAEVLEGLAVTIRETGAEITWDSLPSVQADVTQVGQLFQNLLGNALKYRSEQAPRVHIGVERQGLWWQFAVRDNGIGIDPAYAARIFLVFQRLHTRDEYPGTGIGLALCQKIVERHGGQITVESQVGQGATFTFTLPVVERGDG